jgi:hypothetical protein
VKATLALGVCALLAGCSQGPKDTSEIKTDSGQSAAAGKDACEFMTLADVQDVYGHAMKKSDNNRNFAGPSADVSTCTYEGGDNLRVATMMTTWSKTKSGALASRDTYADSAQKDVPANLREALAVEKVDFQGLPALWQAGQLKVFKEGVMLSVLADPASGKDARATIETLMAKAVGRL